MSLERIRQSAVAAIEETLVRAFGHRPASVVLEVPPRRDLGDLAWPGALPLARELRRSPRDIAQTVAEQAVWPEEVSHVDIAGPGFLNVFLRRDVMLRTLMETAGGEVVERTEKVIVEHTNINPNKAAHIGHLRNAVLGDTLVRCLRRLGSDVEVQNYIDDTGVQVADVVVGVLHLTERELSAALGTQPASRARLLEEFLARIPETSVPTPSTGDFDDLCWDIYPRVTARYQEDEDFAEHRAQVLHAVEGGTGGMDLAAAIDTLKRASEAGDSYPDEAVARFAAEVAHGNVRCHLATMARLAVSYDLLPHESDILHLGFWARAFELLKHAGAIRLEKEGKNAGCWVMSLASSEEFADMDDPDKILVRSNGTVTYTGKDIAYQLWKLGLLTHDEGERHDFGYQVSARWEQDGPALPVRYGASGNILARTTSNPSQRIAGHDYGAGDRVYNVIDVRQSYPQKVVREAVRVLGHPEAAEKSIHFAYEMVALTPAAVTTIEETTGADFGLSSEEMSKSYIEMSGRRGIGVKADEFLDTLQARAEAAVLARSDSAEPPKDLRPRARDIAVGALRYLMARQSRNRVLAFDFDEALAFEGDTGPYLQYSAVRARKIFDKLSDRLGEGLPGADEALRLEGITVPDDLWELVLQCARTGEIVEQAVTNLEFSLLAQHAHGLAQLFHKLYHGHPVLREADPNLRLLRAAVFALFFREISAILEKLLGIPVPEEM